MNFKVIKPDDSFLGELIEEALKRVSVIESVNLDDDPLEARLESVSAEGLVTIAWSDSISMLNFANPRRDYLRVDVFGPNQPYVFSWSVKEITADYLQI